jgi:SanA protein
MTRKRLLTGAFITLSLIALLTWWANRVVNETTSGFVTDKIEQLKPEQVGLLLGTRRTLASGANNPFFYNRIEAAVELYQSGKLKYIIVSGDNSNQNYNEPQDMMLELIKRGIPSHVIYLDYAGFRTLDSVIRAREIFGQSAFIVISQKFHNERAVFLARKNGIEAYGYNAADVGVITGLRTQIRELFARDKVFIDLLVGVRPKFLGEKINIQ